MLGRLLSPTAVSAIAHRGGSGLRPENTMAAFDHAATLGVDGLECDVRLSRDGVPMVIHDDTLERTTDAAGPVAARAADELARVDAGFHFDAEHGFPFRGHGFGVPRLLDVLARHPTMPFVVEIKGEAPGVVPAILDAVDRAGAGDRVIVGAFSQAVLDEVRWRAPDVPTSASDAEIRSAIRRTRLFLRPRHGAFRLLQAPFRYRGRTVFGRRFVAGAKRAGFPVHAWIVDEEADMRTLIGWGVTGLISDRPDVAVRVRDARP
jgi:glycerophosphoryl diester phosphodiesterase